MVLTLGSKLPDQQSTYREIVEYHVGNHKTRVSPIKGKSEKSSGAVGN